MPDAAATKYSREFYWKVLSGIVAFTLYLQFTQHGHLENGGAPTAAVVASFLTFALASVFRWVVIPKIKDEMKRFLAVALGGMALGESISFYGIFLLPPDRVHLRAGLFVASLLCILQFAPFYVAKQSRDETR